MAICHDVFNNNFFKKMIREQNRLLLISMLAIERKFDDFNIDYRANCFLNMYEPSVIKVHIKPKRFIPSFFQKRKIKKIAKLCRKFVIEDGLFLVYYKGEVLVSFRNVKTPCHPNYKSYLTKV